ncbi:hypothetical protein FOVSG1_015544 [Fusarium oxysporum f. sp. vasinfectum]
MFDPIRVYCLSVVVGTFIDTLVNALINAFLDTVLYIGIFKYILRAFPFESCIQHCVEIVALVVRGLLARVDFRSLWMIGSIKAKSVRAGSLAKRTAARIGLEEHDGKQEWEEAASSQQWWAN